MKNRLLLTLAGILVAGAVGLSGIALAQGNGGGGGGKGGGDGGGTPPDYGDLIILYRDEWGKPIVDPMTMCQQPIAFTENVGCPDDGAGLIWNDIDNIWIVPTNPDTCAIEMSFATCTDEADFGRTNLARSSDEVLASQLEDVIINLAIADCTSLDPAGRLVYSRYVGDELKTGTIDSPLQNLAVYKQLVRTGSIGVTLPEGATAKETAARGFGVAMDKAGEVNVDLLVYLNEILGLTEGTTIFGAPDCINVKEEVMGNIELVEKCFLNYETYGYTREANFGSLPSPAYIPEVAPGPYEGWFEFLTETTPDNYIVAEGPILQTVFSDGQGGFEPGYIAGNIEGFAQAADDTRAVINYMHNWPVPADGETAVPCLPDPDPTETFDLSISEMSGLQVPKQIVASTEGREFTVTVANGGPDQASGTLTVTAQTAAGGPVLVNGLEGPFVFEFEELVSGMSYAKTEHFTIGEPHVRTTISWEAVVVANGVDPYEENNSVTATSNVKLTTGGGGH
jgi:hypothetical protein